MAENSFIGSGKRIMTGGVVIDAKRTGVGHYEFEHTLTGAEVPGRAGRYMLRFIAVDLCPTGSGDHRRRSGIASRDSCIGSVSYEVKQ